MSRSHQTNILSCNANVNYNAKEAMSSNESIEKSLVEIILTEGLEVRTYEKGEGLAPIFCADRGVTTIVLLTIKSCILCLRDNNCLYHASWHPCHKHNVYFDLNGSPVIVLGWTLAMRLVFHNF